MKQHEKNIHIHVMISQVITEQKYWEKAISVGLLQYDAINLLHQAEVNLYFISADV